MDDNFFSQPPLYAFALSAGTLPSEIGLMTSLQNLRFGQYNLHIVFVPNVNDNPYRIVKKILFLLMVFFSCRFVVVVAAVFLFRGASIRQTTYPYRLRRS